MFKHWFFQGIVMQLFCELMAYCVTMINASGYYSLALQHTRTTSFFLELLVGQRVPPSLFWQHPTRDVTAPQDHEFHLLFLRFFFRHTPSAMPLLMLETNWAIVCQLAFLENNCRPTSVSSILRNSSSAFQYLLLRL